MFSKRRLNAKFNTKPVRLGSKRAGEDSPVGPMLLCSSATVTKVRREQKLHEKTTHPVGPFKIRVGIRKHFIFTRFDP